MRLFNKTIDRQLFKQYALGSDLSKQEVVVKIFNPMGNGSWYILNSDPQDPDYLWAIVDLGYGAEVGSVSRSDLETYRGRFGLGFERDLGFDPINAEELYNGLSEGKFYANGGLITEEKLKEGEWFSPDMKTMFTYRNGRLGITLFYGKDRRYSKTTTINNASELSIKELNSEVKKEIAELKQFAKEMLENNFADGGEIEVVYERRADFKKKPIKLLLLNKGKEQKGYTFSGKDQVAVLDNYNRNKQEDLEKLWNLKGYETKYADGGSLGNYDVVIDGDWDEPKKFKTFSLAKKWIYENAKNYESLELVDPYGDTIFVEGNATKEDLDWLFSNDEVSSFAKGGNIADFTDNQQMIMNQNVELEHHHEELEDILEDEMPVPAWVVAKMATATQSISDVTHYLDGQKELMEDEDEEENEEEDEDQEEIENRNVVEPINVSAGTKAELTKKFTDDALGNLKGFLKGMEGVDLRDDYTFDYKGEQYEVEPIINSDENGVSNAVFSIFDGDGEEVGDVSYSRDGGKQKFTANSEFFSWNNAKFEDGGFMNGVYADGGEISLWKAEPKNKPEKFKTFKSLQAYKAYMTKNAKFFRDEHSKNGTGFFGFEADATQKEVESSIENLYDSNNQYADGGYFDGTIPKVSTYMSTYAKGGSMNKHFWSWKYAPNDDSYKSVVIYKTDVDDENSYDSVEQIKEQLTKEGVTKFIDEESKHFWSWKYAPNDDTYKSVIIYKTDIDDENSYDSVEQIKEQLVKEGVNKFIEDEEENYAKGGEVAKAEILGLSKNIMGTTDIEMKISGMRKSQDFSVYPIGKDDTDQIITIQSETRIGKIDLSTGRGLMSQSHSNGAYFVHFQMDNLTSFTLNESDLQELKMYIFKTAGDNVGSSIVKSDNSGASGVYAKGGKVDNTHNYRLLDRLRSDNDYFLGNGNRSEKHLWAGNVDAQIKEMKRLWNNLPEDAKPEWLSMDDILEYEQKMKNQYADGGFMADVYKRGGETPKLSELKREDWKHKYGGSTVNFYQTYGDKEFHTQVYKLGDGYEATPGLNNLGLSGFYTKRFENRNEAIKFAKDSIKEQIEEYKAYYTTPKNIKDYVGKHFIYGHTVYYIGGLRKNTVKQGGYSERKGRMVDTSGQYKPSFIVLKIEIDHKLSPYDPNQKVIKGSDLQIIDLDSFKSKKYYNISSKKLPSKIQEKIDSKKEYFERFEGEKLENGGFMNNVYADGGRVSNEDYEKRLQYLKMMKNNERSNLGKYRIDKEIREINTILEHRGNLKNSYAKGGSVKKDWWHTVVNPNQDFNNFDNKMPIDWEVDDFKSWIVSNSDLDGNLDKEVLDIVKMPKSKLLVEYLNKNGSGKNNNEFYKEFGNWQSALYDIFTQLKKDYLFKKSLKYILKADIKTVTVRLKNGKEVTYSGADVLNGNYVLAKGGDITSKANYFGKNNVVGVELKDGTNIKPVNGYWVKKGAEPIGAELTPISSGKSEPKISTTEIRKDARGNWRAENTVDDFNGYDWRISTVKTYSGNLVSSAQGGKTEPTGTKGYSIFKYTMYQDPNHTLEVSKPKRLTDKVVSEQHEKALAKFKKFMETGMFKGGGKISNFDKLSDKVAKEYEGKPVKSQYQEEYGRYYSKEEAQEVGDKVAGKVKAMQTSKKMEGGTTFAEKSEAIAKNFVGKKVEPKYQDEYGKTYDAKEAKEVGNKIAGSMVKKPNSSSEMMKNANDLAKKIRMDGESWNDAKKRAFAQLKK